MIDGTSSSSNTPLLSDFSDDPDMLELVEMFVDDMPSRISALEQAFGSGDIGEISRLSHQLKGAAGGYGFGSITDAAAEVESLAKSQSKLDQIKGSVDELLTLCRRASSNPK